MRIVQRVIALAGLAVVAWIGVTSWGAIVHGHPLYGVLLVLTVAGCVWAGWRSFRDRPARHGWSLVLWIVLVVLGIGWIALMAWLRPFPAVEPALTAMQSTGTVEVVETPTSITLLPGLDMSSTGVFFQPGARVDARAYAAILRPIAEAGHLVVIVKMPYGVALLDVNAASSVIDAEPEVDQWVVAGHSLGGTAAARYASDHPDEIAGLVLWASYPADDLNGDDLAVLSVSGTEDGLTTPADVEDSRADLPPDTEFVAVEGATHAQFGDYGLQRRDGTATISRAEAQRQIVAATLAFLDALDATSRSAA